MQLNHFFYNCSQEYVTSIDHNLYLEISDTLNSLPKRTTQSEINHDIFSSLVRKGWSFDAIPPDTDLLDEKKMNNRKLCLTSSTLNAGWHSDFAKSYDSGLVQLEVQFGKVEAMFKDFCGFRIAYYERRLALGIEIVMSNPGEYFADRKKAISGMAYFDIAKRTLPAIGLDCPIWLIGISE